MRKRNGTNGRTLRERDRERTKSAVGDADEAAPSRRGQVADATRRTKPSATEGARAFGRLGPYLVVLSFAHPRKLLNAALRAGLEFTF